MGIIDEFNITTEIGSGTMFGLPTISEICYEFELMADGLTSPRIASLTADSLRCTVLVKASTDARVFRSVRSALWSLKLNQAEKTITELHYWERDHPGLFYPSLGRFLGAGSDREIAPTSCAHIAIFFLPFMVGTLKYGT